MELSDRLDALVTNRTTALVWRQLGAHIVPWCYVGAPPRQRKKPMITGWARGEAISEDEGIYSHWREHPDHYPGILTGPASGIWVLDLDVKDGKDGIEAFKAIAAGRPLPPDAIRVWTPSGGMHVYFAWEDGISNSQGELGPGIDVRGAGGYVVAGGVVTPAGQYRFVNSEDLPERPAPAPEWLVDLVKRTRGTPAWDGEYHREVTSIDDLASAADGEQEGALFKYLARLHREGVDPEEATRRGWEGAQTFTSFDPANPWTYEDVQAKVKSLWARTEFTGVTPPIPPEARAFVERLAAEAEIAPLPGTTVTDVEEDVALIAADGFRTSESGNALRLVALADGKIRYVDNWSKWMVYSNGRWWIDPADARVREVAKGVARRLFALAGSDAVTDSAEREHLFKFALRSESASQIGAMVNLARAIPGVIVNHDDLDADPWLLNCLNGTIDLRTGELRAHNPDDLMTMQVPVVYNPQVRSSLWETCVQTWLPDPEVRAFVQRAVGSGATGHPVEALIVNIGQGGNGKSKFFGALADVLGPFAVIPHKSLIVATRQEVHPTHKASLFRARMLLVPETGQGARIDEEQVKALTGGDPIEARRMREDEWKFLPTHTAFMHTNYPPVIRGADEGIWRRVKLVDWQVTIPAAKRDEQLAIKLRAEATGVLSWLVEGAVEWARQGLADPPQVQASTARYREENDTVGQFLEWAQLEFGEGLWTPAGALSDKHNVWFATAGLPGRAEVHYQRVTAALKLLPGVEAKSARSRGGRYWSGVGWPDAPVAEHEVDEGDYRG